MKVWFEVAPWLVTVGISVLTFLPMVAGELVRPGGMPKATLDGTLVGPRC